MRRISLRACGAALLVIVLAATPAIAGSTHGAKPHKKTVPYQSPFRRLVWHDEFNGPAGSLPNPANWQIETGGGGWGNDELQYYTNSPSNVSLDGHGHLAVTALHQTYSDGQNTDNYTSAALLTQGKFQKMYGRIEARIKLPAGVGLWPAFWAVGNDSDRVTWPGGGEIDIMENIGANPFWNFAVIHGPASYNQYGYNLITIEHSPTSLASSFHTYAIDWSPGKIVFTLDGKVYATRTARALPHGATWVFNRPFYMILDLAVGGDFPGSPDSSTHFPATMLVDWVRAYSR